VVFHWNSKEALRAGQMIKTFPALIHYLHDLDMVWILNFGHSYLFRPALPVPRPGRDREARHDMEIILSRHDYGLHGHKLGSLKPACPGLRLVAYASESATTQEHYHAL